MSQPETGALITEYTLAGGVDRTFGALRAHRPRRRPRAAPGAEQRHPARRSDAAASSSSSRPASRCSGNTTRRHSWSSNGTSQGREIDAVVANLPTTLADAQDRRRRDAARAARRSARRRSIATGNLWVAFVVPYTYVFDATATRSARVQFRGAGILAPTSLFLRPTRPPARDARPVRVRQPQRRSRSRAPAGAAAARLDCQRASLTRRFGARTAVDDVTFECRALGNRRAARAERRRQNDDA